MNLQEVHDSWKEKGFPYYPKDKKWRDHIFNQLINFKRDTLVDRRNKVFKLFILSLLLGCVLK